MNWLLSLFRKREPDAFAMAMASFDHRIQCARKQHKPTRAIEQERMAFTHGALKAR